MQSGKELLKKLKKFEELEAIANKADAAYEAEPENAEAEAAFDKAYKAEFQAMEELLNGIVELTNGDRHRNGQENAFHKAGRAEENS